MTAPARLLSVRLQGFKSFAERTHVAFGPGISAVVGPNGSGKSNLADALRWALGEQGRALRTRKSEDVIWAGSERRPALGMADVQLVLDNGDGLLPVDYGVVELGRRLFRSGENEYILNRQRVRLRDLVDLLDSAHLAENAFLFIGQGMVDQALALRPEERRPLFEEVAGVRRHERRRRRAEEQLAESEANLARVEDIVGELRPQVRRLAAQAQQQASRRDAGEELTEALLAAAHGRWHGAASRLAQADRQLVTVRGGLEAAMTELAAREAEAGDLATRLEAQAAIAQTARAILDTARDALTARRLEAGRFEAEADAIARDRSRLEEERATVDARLTTDRRAAAMSGGSVDPNLERDLREAEAALAGATAALGDARATTMAVEAEHEAARRAEAARAADLDLARRRRAELERDQAEEGGRASAAAEARDEAAAAHDDAVTALAQATAREGAARIAEAEAATAVGVAVAARDSAAARSSEAVGRVARARGDLAAVQDAIAAIERGGLGVAARAAGGRRIDHGLVIAPELRAAVGAALGEHATGFLVPAQSVAGLADERGSVVVQEAIAGGRQSAGATSLGGADQTAADRRMQSVVVTAGGGMLADAIVSDASGTAATLLARAAWLPDLAACLALQPAIAPGWLLVAKDGRAVVGGAAVTLGTSTTILDRRAEAERLSTELRVLEATAADLERMRTEATTAVDEASAVQRDAAAARQSASDARRAAEALEAASGRRAESAAREAAWLEAQADRLAAALARAVETLAQLEAPAAVDTRATAAGEAQTEVQAEAQAPAAVPAASAGSEGSAPHVAALERRVLDIRATRDRLEAAWRDADAGHRAQERERARAEASVAMAERRLTEVEAALATLATREATIARASETARAAMAEAGQAVERAGAELQAILDRDAAERRELGGAERAAAAAREALRRLQDAGRVAEREELEARLGLESLREQLLVELAGLGELGIRHLARHARSAGIGGEPTSVRTPGSEAPAPGSEAAAQAGPPGTADASGMADAPGTAEEVALLEAALTAVARQWATNLPPEEQPSSARLASLRRRFHELGAANPYALEEHAALAARLETLETQRTDLLAAVEKTRTLIAELDGLIANQFRTTFASLERAFDARFQQLFGGGFAHLVLTEPGDLAATGIEITARPPGKKPQALAMLSGGERALTAVALLFAMLEVRPVPFCVLDEVDAALDEANVGRFTDALRDIARTTQVIVITHNRGTIETADALYGVTVGDDSVSRVISLRLEEATALAGIDADGATATGLPAAPPAPRAPIIPAGLTPLELADVPEGAA
jgi:chromosome segregation protein